jgi:mannose-6-phosphate isomerase
MEDQLEFGLRPWGNYQVLSDEADHKVKRITVNPGKRLSLQRHQRRSEHWFLLQGDALLTIGDATLPWSAGDSADIAKGTLHRVENRGPSPVIFIEVQTGDYFGEDDIERIEDDFGRRLFTS